MYKKFKHFINQLKHNSFIELMTEYVYDPNDSNEKIAMSVLVGIFIGLSPLVGYHIILGLGAAAIFNLNKAITVLSVNISFPPLIPFIFFAEYKLGTFLVPENHALTFSRDISFAMLRDHLYPFLLGSLVMSIIGALFFSGVTYVLLQFFRNNGKTKTRH